MREIDANKLQQMIVGAYELLNENKELVNDLNVFPVPDGDTGTNMTMTMRSGVDRANEINTNNVADITKALSQGTLMGARGNSGVILSQLVRGLSKATKGKTTIIAQDIKEIFNLANKTAYKAVMKPTEGTILTVSQKMTDKASEIYTEEIEIDKYLYEIITAGQIALDNTPNQLPVLKEAGVVDSGGQGLMILLKGAFAALNSDYQIENIKSEGNIKTDDLPYILNAELALNEDSYQKSIESIKSMAEIIDQSYEDNILKIKIKTDSAVGLIQMLSVDGIILKLDLENTKADLSLIEKTKEKPLKKYGFIAVSRGEGYDAILKSMEIDEIISGGQTMNPSTEDIYNSLDRIKAENIIIFPNNKNIIMSAKQACQITDKNAVVVETRSIPETFSAMLEFDEDSDINENVENMNQAIKDLHIAEFSISIRDTSVSGVEIKKDDYLGILDGKIVKSERKLEVSVIETLSKAIEKFDDVSLITIYYGKEIDKKDANNLAKKLEKKFKDIDTELIYGGQPVYYYTITLE